MSIKQQFFLLISIVVISMIVQIGLDRYITNTLLELEQEKTLLAQIEAGMLMLRRNEKDFLMRKDLKYLEKFEANHKLLQQKVQGISEKLKSSDIENKDAIEVGTILEQYSVNFHALVSVQQEIGLHHKDGLYGSLRNAVHGIEKLVKEQREYQLFSDMLMLRRNEKDFMLRDDLKYETKYNNNIAKFEQTLAASTISVEVKNGISQALKKYKTDFLSLVDGYKRKGLSPSEGIRGQLRATVHRTETLIKTLVDQVNSAIAGHKNQANILKIGSSLLLVLVLAGLLLWLSGFIRHPIRLFTDTLKQAAENRDLTLRANIKNKGEISEMACSFNGMMDEFQKLLNKVTESAHAVTEASHQITQVASSTSSGMQQQRTESDQVATAMNEMTATVQEVAQSAARAADTSSAADQEASAGSAEVKKSIKGIQELAKQVEDVATTIKELEQQSGNIDTVLSVITGIAEQTNLLALNAAIEAARAGEQGRGFAVVADEVRTLAQRSQDATEEIKNIIEKLQNKSQDAVAAMEAGSNQVLVTVKQAQQGGASLQAISESIATIRDMNTQIATASEQQSAVADEINQSIVRIAQVSDESATGTEQLDRTSIELAGLANQLQENISNFKVT
ncbi:MAG: HAMP domain-containing methyl-accepting chemotaxis protein [Candidatus Thiodiazotropha endolucinida]